MLKMHYNRLVYLLLVIYYQKVICSVNDQNRTTAKINFLNREVRIPSDVNDTAVSAIQNLLNYYEGPLLKFGQQLVGCNESGGGQFEICWEIYNQFTVSNTVISV